jgi:hypothetical protein
MNKIDEIKEILKKYGIRDDIDDIAKEIDDIYYEGLWIMEGDGKRKATINDIVKIANTIK